MRQFARSRIVSLAINTVCQIGENLYGLWIAKVARDRQSFFHCQSTGRVVTLGMHDVAKVEE